MPLSITLAHRHYTFADLRELMAKATPARSGDQLAGLGASSAAERVAAQTLLADIPLTRFLEDLLIPCEADEVTRLIINSHDATTFAPIKDLTVGQFREHLLAYETVADGVKQIVIQTGRSLAGISAADGKLLWKMATPPNGRAYNAPSPVVDGSIIYYTGGSTGVKAFKVEKIGDTFAAKELWTNDQFGGNFSTPMVKENHIYGLAERGTLFCIDVKTGKPLWNKTGIANGGYGSVVDAGNVLLVLNSRAELRFFKHDDKAYEELANLKVGEGQTYALPIPAPGRIYITEQGLVSAVAME